LLGGYRKKGAANLEVGKCGTHIGLMLDGILGQAAIQELGYKHRLDNVKRTAYEDVNWTELVHKLLC
jgi:hypothetical protein